jgi:predicted O-methyltransferase YrrM
MYSPFQLARKYLNYYFTSANGKGHGMHSPFVFELISEVLNDDRSFYAYQSIERVRQMLLYNKRVLEIEDLGAGSRTIKSKSRSVQSSAKSALKSKKFSQLLFRMVDHYQPGIIVELGTSFGITTAYLASANINGKVITLEGSEAIADIALENFAKLKLKNIELVKGNFDDQLPAVLSSLPTVDLAFIDGNHRYQPTLNYFEQILAKSNHKSIIILDDIHWSREMEEAWQAIQQHSAVTMTIDLFFLGIVLLRDEFKVKQHFSVRF